MRKVRLIVVCLLCLPMVQASAMGMPTIPEDAQALLPAQETGFAESLLHILKTALGTLQPQLASSAGLCL